MLRGQDTICEPAREFCKLGAVIAGAAGSTGGATASVASSVWPDLSLGSFYRARSAGGAPALRVGVIVHASGTSQFGRSLLEDLRACPYVTLACVLHAPGPGRGGDFVLRAAPAAFRLYQRLVARKPGPALGLGLDPLAAATHQDLLAGVPVLACEMSAHRELTLAPPTLQALLAAQLDLIVNLTACTPAAQLAGAARHGLWYYRVAGETIGATPLPGLREFIDREPVTTTELRAMTADGSGELILRQLHTATSMQMLPDSNVPNPFWCAQHLLLSALCAVHTQGWPALRQEAPPAPPARRRLARPVVSAALLARLGARVAARVWRRIRIGQRQEPLWYLGVRRSALPLYARATAQDMRSFRWVPNPPGHYLADPFLFEHDGQTWLFFEDFSFATNRGTLSCARLGDDGQLLDVGGCLERPYHLSYPQVIRTADGIFMIPETADAGVVELYRATSFPYQWEWSAKLLDLRAVDSTIVQAAGRWWMFTSPMAAPAHAPATLLFAADELHGPWTLQERCSVSVDAATARGAGAIVDSGDGLIRPSQDCTLEYGRRLLFNRIGALSAAGYREHTAMAIEPGWLPGMVGVHSYARAGNWEVVDGLFESGTNPC